MYRFTAIFLLIMLACPAHATRTVVTQTPVYNPYYSAYYGGDYIPPNHRYNRKYSTVFPDINDLEKYAMNKNFPRENDISRLERLENLAFGAIQEGNIYTRYDNVRNAILSRPKNNQKSTLLRSISDYFGGQITGFTPSINSFNSGNIYSNPYGKNSSSEYITPWGHSYNTNNYGTGTTSTVQLLD